VVQVAALGVGQQQLTSLLPAVVGLLKHKNLQVRMASARAVSMFGVAALPHLTAIQDAADHESDPRVRQTMEGAALRLRGIRQ
jgi:HEAT repeat protein